MNYEFFYRLYRALPKPLRVAVDYVIHLIGAGIVVAGIETFERVFWSAPSPMLFERFPVRYLTDSADGAVLLTFIYFATKSAIETFRE